MSQWWSGDLMSKIILPKISEQALQFFAYRVLIWFNDVIIKYLTSKFRNHSIWDSAIDLKRLIHEGISIKKL